MAGDGTHVHGTCVALGEACVLLRGAPGAGKSDLALRFLTMFGPESEGAARLVADDQTLLAREAGKLIARAPAATAGSIEVRGIGIVAVAHRPEAELVLVADLVGPTEVERLPDPLPQTTLLDVSLPCLRVAPFEASAPIKLKIALASCLQAHD